MSVKRFGMEEKMKLGEKIVKLRKEKGLSQEALAEQIGTTRQAVSKWENDQGFPETEKLLQLSNVFESVYFPRKRLWTKRQMRLRSEKQHLQQRKSNYVSEK